MGKITEKWIDEDQLNYLKCGCGRNSRSLSSSFPLWTSMSDLYNFLGLFSHVVLCWLSYCMWLMVVTLSPTSCPVLWTTALLSQPKLCMATDLQQWEWAANQQGPPVATWRPFRRTRSGSCPTGSEAPRPSARSVSCSYWWRRKSAGWNGRVRYRELGIKVTSIKKKISIWDE